MDNEACKVAGNQPVFCWHHGSRARLYRCLDHGYCDLGPLDDQCLSRFWKRHRLKPGDRVRFSVRGEIVACGTIDSNYPYDLRSEKGIEPVSPRWPSAVDIIEICRTDGSNCGSCIAPPKFGSHWL